MTVHTAVRGAAVAALSWVSAVLCPYRPRPRTGPSRYGKISLFYVSGTDIPGKQVCGVLAYRGANYTGPARYYHTAPSGIVDNVGTEMNGEISSFEINVGC